MEFEKVIWLLDHRFDFLLPWFEEEFGISEKDILFVGSYHGSFRSELKTVTVGDIPAGHVAYLEPEDINKLYAGNIPQNENILIVPFSGAYLPSGNNILSFVSTGKLAVEVNNKWWQYGFFCDHQVKSPRTWRVRNQLQLLELSQTLFQQHMRLLIKKSELSGGYKMVVVSSLEEVYDYCEGQEEAFLNGAFLISEYISHKQSFSGVGIIGKSGNIVWCGATEQVLYHDLAYEGLIWPPYIDEKGLHEIEQVTRKVGKGLSEYGYFGYYNVDFIQGIDGMYAVEINARICFSTIFFGCCWGKRFWQFLKGNTKVKNCAKGRLIIGKIKAKEGKCYSNLAGNSNITEWYDSGEGAFQTYFVGTGESEYFEHGSFIGIFGEILPMKTDREETLKVFWSRCLEQYG